MNAADELTQHRIPCGPVTVSASAVCRRRLRDMYDKLLDRLTEDIHPDYTAPELPEDHEFDKKGNIVHKDEIARRKKAHETMKKGKEKIQKEREKNAPMSDEMLEMKKEKLLQEAKLKVDVKKEALKYEEKTMGNSKLLQNTSGKIKKR